MKIFIAFVLMIGCTVAANLLLKTGASELDFSEGLFAKAPSWQLIGGMICFGMAAVIYALILSWLPLNVAQSFAAAQFLAVIFAARFILSEPINMPQWIGIAFIAFGIGIVGWSR